MPSSLYVPQSVALALDSQHYYFVLLRTIPKTNEERCIANIVVVAVEEERDMKESNFASGHN